MPEYELKRTGLRVRFKALESAIIDQAKEPKHQRAKNHGTLDGVLALRIISIIRINPDITLDKLSEQTDIARRTLTRYMKILQEENKIERIGGKRYGHWHIITE